MNKTIIWTGGTPTPHETVGTSLSYQPRTILEASDKFLPRFTTPAYFQFCVYCATLPRRRPNDGPRLSEVSPLHATLNCGYRHHGCMCRSCVSQLIRRNPFLRQYVASLTGRMLMVAGRDMLIPGRLASPPSRAETAANLSG